MHLTQSGKARSKLRLLKGMCLMNGVYSMGCFWPQRGQVGTIVILHCLTFSGVGRVSVLLSRESTSDPLGGPVRFSSRPD